MQPGQDPLSFTSRKSAANQLPPFELPAPPFKAPSFKALHSKYHQSSDPDRDYPPPQSGSVASAGNLLTPPNTLLGEGASPNPQNAGNSSSSDPSSCFSGPSGYWSSSQSNGPQYGPYNSASSPQWIPPRGMFSPSSMDSILRHNGSETEMMQSHSYEMHQLPPFGGSMSLPTNSTLPAMNGLQHQQSVNNAAMMNAQQQMPNGNSQVSPVSSQDVFSARPPPTPAYFPPSNPSPSNAQMSFAPYSAPHRSQTSPISPSNSSQHRMSPPGTSDHVHMSIPSHQQSPPPYQRSYGQFPPPAMNGPVLSNIQNPGGQMALVGSLPNSLISGFNSGHAANMQQMYGAAHTSQQQQQSNDRPFKCDQCVQSFNRNHDLKRHKRIHLAVKPFPCGHCDKSFSRKDALKRHILVKGCDKSKGGDSSSNNKDSSPSVSPIAKPETANGLHLGTVGSH